MVSKLDMTGSSVESIVSAINLNVLNRVYNAMSSVEQILKRVGKESLRLVFYHDGHN